MNRLSTLTGIVLALSGAACGGDKPSASTGTAGAGDAGPGGHGGSASGSAGAGGIAGASAGTGGASAGTGGALAGTGGASAGTGAGAGASGASGATGAAGALAGSGGTASGGAGGAGGGMDQDGGVRDAADTGTALEPIRVTEGKADASTYYDLRFVGARLDQYEGAVVTFRIGPTSGTSRTGTGQTRIVQGAFDVLFPDVVSALYEPKLAHIDADRNGMCEVGEPVFLDFALYNNDITLTFAPDAFEVREATSGMCASVNDWPIQ